MGSSGLAAVYCLKKFKENYLKDKEEIDKVLREDCEVNIDLGGISDLNYKELCHKLFGEEWNSYINLFNESLILYGNSIENDEYVVPISALEAAGAEIACIFVY